MGSLSIKLLTKVKINFCISESLHKFTLNNASLNYLPVFSSQKICLELFVCYISSMLNFFE